MTVNTINSKLRRRWLQFNLRTLMLFMLVVAIACGWFAHKLYKARQQRKAVAAIIGMGGGVRYDNDQSPLTIQRNQGWLANFLGVDFYQEVVAVSVGPNVTGEVLTQLDSLHRLNQLGFRSTSVSDSDLVHLHEWPLLQYLYLGGTEISDAGLKHVEGCSNLVELELSETKITDAGLKSIKGLTRLERLRLGSTNITDSGLECLQALPRLRNVDISGTQVTDAGRDKLRDALPGLRIEARY